MLVRPDQVTRMTDAQAALASDQDREAWLVESMRPATGYIEGRWYGACAVGGVDTEFVEGIVDDVESGTSASIRDAKEGEGNEE